MFNIYLTIYIILAIFVIGSGSFSLNKSANTLGAILFFVGSFVVFMVFGLKWFSPGSTFSETPVSWPPQINTCPDYLVYYNRTMPDGTTQGSCIDLIGVSKNGSLKVFPKNSNPAPTDNDYYFSLQTQSNDSSAKNAELCQRTISFGLTWEGITNGESCITPSGPVGPNGGGGGSNGNNCPQ
jgi:hypothetical protein